MHILHAAVNKDKVFTGYRYLYQINDHLLEGNSPHGIPPAKGIPTMSAHQPERRVRKKLMMVIAQMNQEFAAEKGKQNAGIINTE